MPADDPAAAPRAADLRQAARAASCGRGSGICSETLLPLLAVTLPETGVLDPASLFATRPGSVWLEIGFGAGEHLAAQAEAHPEIGFIGCEVFENGVARLVAEIARRDLTNIRIFPDDARVLLDALAPASLDRVFILFPDPWPKTRHHKRRLVSTATLDRLAVLMRKGAELRLATDERGYLAWMLEHATAHPAFAMAGAPPFRLARAPRRLAADPLRGEGARSRPHPGLSALRAAGLIAGPHSAFPDGREFFRPGHQIFSIYKRFSDIPSPEQGIRPGRTGTVSRRAGTLEIRSRGSGNIRPCRSRPCALSMPSDCGNFRGVDESRGDPTLAVAA